jgi:crotonobetainyl-CoA:carnitine CoA-transferase CaiB-like acyl-CoA transferase
MNRNKLGMTLDPAVPKGGEIVRKLVATADVIVARSAAPRLAVTGARS